MSEKLRVAELTELVETQREQLRRYEGRLRDLIRAYKSLQKEKEALEASVKALSVVQEEDSEEEEVVSRETGSDHKVEERDEGSPASTTAPSSSSPSSSPAPASTTPSTPPTTPSTTEYQSNPLPSSPSVRSVVHSDAEDVASSIDAASASEAEKTDSEDAGDERLPHSLTASSPKQSQQNQQNQKHQRLKSQVATLSNALAAITSEKNKMESSFQADKRRAMEEKEEMASALVVEKNAKESEVAAMRTQVNELKAKLRSEQLEREQEQTDHVVMLSELQTLLTQQKRARETLEQQLEEEKTERKKLTTALQAQEAMAAFAPRPSVKAEEEKPKSTPTLNVETHPIVVKMKKDYQETKTQLHRALQQERSRAREAEEQIVRTNRTSEEVVRNLEDRITELSATVGTYERLRVQDQRSMETLKEELEKRLLAADSSSSTSSSVLSPGRPRERLPPIGANPGEEDQPSLKFVMNEELSSDPRYLLTKMRDLKTKMQVVLTSPLFEGEDLSSREIADAIFDKIEMSDLHSSCREEAGDLESEVARLTEQLTVVTQRAKAESPVKISFDENEILKRRIVELEKEVISCQDELLAKERKMQKEVEESNERLFRTEKREEEARKEEEEKWKDKLDEVVKEMKKQRDRTMSLLQQKEAEVEAARNDAVELVASSRERTISRQGSTHRSRHNSFVSEDRRSPSLEPGFSCMQEDLGGGHQLERALSADGTGAGSGLPVGGATLHVACREALSRVQADLRLIRKQKGEAETALRKIHNSVAMTEENHRSQVEKLTFDVERLTRNEQRASELGRHENLEYLKNVVYKLIISRDSASKLQLIPVVATILQFTADEKHKALSKYQSWWATPSASSTSITANNTQS